MSEYCAKCKYDIGKEKIIAQAQELRRDDAAQPWIYITREIVREELAKIGIVKEA